MAERTFGWIQDPGNIKKLRKVVEVFDSTSIFHKKLKTTLIPKLVSKSDGRMHLLAELNACPLKLKYKDLVGKAFRPRKIARCNGIIQAALKGQKRAFLADWPADNFLRWAQAVGFVKWHKESDSFEITDLGLALTHSKENSNEEYEVYKIAFLSYPPVARILDLLADSAQRGFPLTKFEIGCRLGFIGEEGFTSISQTLFVREINCVSKKERPKIRSNWEGDSDKYARMICGWLLKLKKPWTRQVTKTVQASFADATYSYKMQAYTITKEGFEIRKNVSGASRFSKISKIVSFEMLCTKGKDRQYLRHRRAYILKIISAGYLTLEDIQSKLNEKGFNESGESIRNDLLGLMNIGIRIDFSNGKYYCADKIIGLEIPAAQLTETRKSEILDLTEKCRSEITCLPHAFLVLIPISFDSKQSRLFEIKVIELLTEHCNFMGLHLGSAHRPDGLIYNNKYGVILDTKSYGEGFNIPVSERDKMKRYIDENKTRNPNHNKTRWWEKFPNCLKEFLFLFISGKFCGNFANQLKLISETTNNTLGGAITAYALLRIADGIKAGSIDHSRFKQKISCLDEVRIEV